MSQSFNNLDISVEYEPLGNFTHLVVTIDKNKSDIYTNQVKSLQNCNTDNLLQIKECDYNSAKIRYDVTSKVSLADVFSRRKIRRGEFSQLVLGIINAVEEIGGYGALTNAGLIYDTRFIFVSATSLTPEMMYLPIYRDVTDLSVFREFIRNLFAYSRIENTRDAFSNVILDRINQEPFTLKDFKEAILGLGEFGTEIPAQRPHSEGMKIPIPEMPAGLPVNEPLAEENVYRLPGSVTSPGVTPVPAYEERRSAESALPHGMFPPYSTQGTNAGPIRDLPIPPARSKGKINKRKIKSVILFVVLNLALISLFLWLIFWYIGIENVLINLDYISISLAAFAVAGIESILVKALFFSKKSKKTKKRSYQKSANHEKQVLSNPELPVMERVPQINSQPAQVPRIPPQTPPQSPSISPQNIRDVRDGSYSLSHAWMNSGEKPVPGISVKSSGSIPDTVVISNPNSISGVHKEYPFLECVISGVLARIYINKEKFVIGRDPSECAYVCRYDADDVGKVHAEIITRGRELYIKDLNSRNHTYLSNEGDSGEAVFQLSPDIEYRLYQGAKIRLASKTVFTVNIT